MRAIREMAKKMGRAPSRAEFTRRTGTSKYFVLKWFRCWTEAVKSAGLEPSALNARIEDRALLEEWGSAVRKNGGILPRHVFRRMAKYNPLTLAKRFGGWLAVPQAFRKFARGKREWADVVAALPAYVRRDALKRAPTWNRKADSSALVYGGPQPKGRNDNWLRATRASGVKLRKRWHAMRADRPTYGNPTPYRWLRHEPVNEQGVVLLFGMLAKELGYVIETVGTGFPDCEAKRQVGPGRWQRVRIEFEFESRNFAEHAHRVEGCDVIVCWKHNWEECPENIEVVELSKERLEIGG